MGCFHDILYLDFGGVMLGRGWRPPQRVQTFICFFHHSPLIDMVLVGVTQALTGFNHVFTNITGSLPEPYLNDKLARLGASSRQDIGKSSELHKMVIPEHKDTNKYCDKFKLHLQVQYISAEHGFRVQAPKGCTSEAALDCLETACRFFTCSPRLTAVQLSRLRTALWRACICADSA